MRNKSQTINTSYCHCFLFSICDADYILPLDVEFEIIKAQFLLHCETLCTKGLKISLEGAGTPFRLKLSTTGEDISSYTFQPTCEQLNFF